MSDEANAVMLGLGGYVIGDRVVCHFGHRFESVGTVIESTVFGGVRVRWDNGGETEFGGPIINEWLRLHTVQND